jgi:hypothetical protein
MNGNGNSNEQPQRAGGSRAEKFDRAMGALVGIPGVTSTSPATVRAVSAHVGDARTFIVQTFRQRDEDEGGKSTSGGDWLFIEYVDDEGAVRVVIPPNVTKVIARQRDALTARARKRGAKAAAATRKAAGMVPGFMKNPGKRSKEK